MPPEPLPWDRKDFFKERKHERSSDSVGSVSRWREAPYHGSSSSRDFGRWGLGEFRSRPPGHGKQGGWHPYSEGSGLTPYRSNDKILDGETWRASTPRAEGRYNRNSRENRGFFNQKSWKGRPWENCASPRGSGRPLDVSDRRSVDDMLTCNSHHHSDFVNTWDRFHFKDQHDKTANVNGLGTGQRFERGRSVGFTDWKPLKWNRTGSLSSRSSGFTHPRGSKSIGSDSCEAKAKLKLGSVSPVHSPSGDAVGCATSAAPSEETSSRKKQRLSWGEGLAKFEKKKVEGPDDSVTDHGMVFCDSIEPLHTTISNLADRSPRVEGFSDCASPATPSSVGCTSSPGVGDKPYLEAANVNDAPSNLSSSPSLLSRDHLEGKAYNLKNLNLSSNDNSTSSLSELLPSDNPGSEDSSLVRCTSMKKLLVWKASISKSLEKTESEIDSLENELKSLISDSRASCPFPAGSSSFVVECQVKPCEDLVVASNSIPHPASLRFVSSPDMILDKAVDNLNECDLVRDKDADSTGTITSEFVGSLSSSKGAECSHDVDASNSGKLEVKCSMLGTCEEKPGGLSSSEGAGKMIETESSDPPVGMNVHCDRADFLCDLILASNKASADTAAEVFKNLFPSNQCHIDISRPSGVSSLLDDPLLKEKLAMKKRFLKFKERVITTKFRAFRYLWKEDLQLLSIRKHRVKSQRKLELNSRTLHGSYQKYRSSTRSCLSSPARNLILAPTKEMINFTSKLLMGSQFKLYRNSLKMPSLILGKKEKIISQFISSNGLVEDPCVVEKERAMINPWTSEEKEIFMDKFSTFGKDFRKIASFLDYKTTADCIEFYYKNHKSKCFVKTKKKPESAKQGKFCSTSNYLVTSGKRWNLETNAASLDMLGAASAIADDAYDDGMVNQQKCTSTFLSGATSVYRAPRGDDGIVERSSNFDVFDSDRETAAADVLAGICGSLSSEAVSSCITSSVDRGESYQDWKCQKMSSSTRQPLTPEVTQNVDDETCSDESCGEMDSTDWTDEEKSIFMQALSSYGKDFAMISRCVRTRSRDQCKVFFSKARMCLGLDMIRPTPGNEGMPVSHDANGGGSDNEDACVLQTGSVICSERSGSKVDEDLMISDSNMDQCDSVRAETMKSSEENAVTGRPDCKDSELPSELLAIDDLRQECTVELDLDGNCNMESADSLPVTMQALKICVLPPDCEIEGDEAGGGGSSFGEPSSFEVSNHHDVSASGAEVHTLAVSRDSNECLVTDLEGKHQASENGFIVKQDRNRDANVSGSHAINCAEQDLHADGIAFGLDLAADTNTYVKCCASREQDQTIALDLTPTQKPLVISMKQDVSLVKLNGTASVTPASQYKKQETVLALDFKKTADKQFQKSAIADDYIQHQSMNSVSGCAGSCRILGRYPLMVPTEKEVTGDPSSKKLTSLQTTPSVVGRKSHSDLFSLQDCLIQKCDSSTAQSSVPKLPLCSQEQNCNHSRPDSWSSSDSKKPGRNGDVKLFGQILTHPSTQPKHNTIGVHENEDGAVQNSTLSSKNLNMKITRARSVDANSVSTKSDHDNYPGLENVPMRSYGFWDGNRIQTGFRTLPDSALLLAKYPAAFTNYPASLSKREQQPLHSVVKSNESSLSGLSVFSNGEMSSSNGVAECKLYSNQASTMMVQPFTVDIKRHPDILFSEMQRRNGIEAFSSIQQQAKGAVGINVVGKEGILGGVACTGVSDPVAAIKMHYANTGQYGGQTASIIREEESWRIKGDPSR